LARHHAADAACSNQFPSYLKAPADCGIPSGNQVVHPYLQTALLLLLLVAALAVLLFQRPYTDDLFNRLEMRLERTATREAKRTTARPVLRH